jgi:hypothetical protein
MKSMNLKCLYLDNNNFNDISPIINANFPNLEVLSFNRNIFDVEGMGETPELIELKQKVNKEGHKINILLEDLNTNQT